jgi:hypothetical protein
MRRIIPRSHVEKEATGGEKMSLLQDFSAVAEGRTKKKEGMDIKQARPKADEAVTSVSAAPTVVDNIKLAAQSKGRLSLQRRLWLISLVL